MSGMQIGTAVELHDGLDEGEWLATRRGVITATAASACAGSQPYYSIVQLWEEQTNPEWDAESARNRWLDMYAANGHVAEPRIIEWASEALRMDFTPSHALVGLRADIDAGVAEPAAATPDGFAALTSDGGGELIEAKTAQKDWAPPPEGWDGDVWIVHADDDWKTAVPQHVQDQCEWQLYVTELNVVWVALEVTKWTGRGTNKVASVVGRRIIEYRSNPARRAFLIERVEWFRHLKANGIAPESEVDLRGLADVFDPFDDDAVAGNAARVALDRIAELDEALKPLQEERDRLSAEVKDYVTGLEGRRVDAVASKYTARLIRSFQSKTNTAALTETERRRITTWAERETMTIVPTEETTA